MVDFSRLHDALGRFVHVLTGRCDIGRVLYELTHRAVPVLEADGAGVAVSDDGRLQFVTATDEQITRRAGDRGRPAAGRHGGGLHRQPESAG